MEEIVKGTNDTQRTEHKVTDTQKVKIRNLVSGIYDIQKLRIATGNRIVQSFNIQMGQKPSTSQEDMEKETQSMINKLRAEYSRITDAYINKSYVVKIKEGDSTVEKTINIGANAGIDKVIKSITADDQSGVDIIKNKLDYELIGSYVGLLDTENRMIKILTKEVEQHPMWDAFFKDVVGCGPLMSAVCIAYFDIDVARHVSSFWKYAGLDTVDVEVPKIIGWDSETGKPIRSETETEHVREGRGLRHTEMRKYIDKNGEEKEKRSITYNAELKTRLLGVLGPCFLKKPGCKYEQIYRDYRNRLDNRADSEHIYPLRKHRMALRYMIKQFVRDMWVTWRELAGYEVTEPYEVAYLGRKPHKYNEYHERVALATAGRNSRVEAVSRKEYTEVMKDANKAINKAEKVIKKNDVKNGTENVTKKRGRKPKNVDKK